MNLQQTRRSLLITGFLLCAFLFLVPATAGAQDDKGPVGSFNCNMATTAELLRLSSIWNVTECCGWVDTWWRRPNTNIFDAKARHTNGTIVTFTVELIILEQDDEPDHLLPGWDQGDLLGVPGQRRREHRPRHDLLVPGGDGLVGGEGDTRSWRGQEGEGHRPALKRQAGSSFAFFTWPAPGR